MGENQNELDEYEEAEARRDRTIAILESESVPYLERLPLIESEANIPRRRDREVALRASEQSQPYGHEVPRSELLRTLPVAE